MRSIRVSLVAMLVAAFTLVTFLAALLGYRASMLRAEELLDNQLSFASELLRSSGTAGVAPPSNKTAGFAFQVWREGRLRKRSAAAPDTPIARLVPGYDYYNFGGHRWRTLAVAGEGNTWFLVAERADWRFAMAEQVVLESVLPFLTWLPLAGLLIWVLVGWGLLPLRSLSTQINRKASDDLQPLVYRDPPRELEPLIESTNALLTRLAAALQREKQIASHAAHELRTPLSGLKVHLHNLRQLVPADNPSLQHMQGDVERLGRLVEQMLDLARTQPELLPARLQRIQLQELAQRVTASLWPACVEQQLSLALAGEPVVIEGDEELVEIVLRNLLDNARKYTPAGGEIEVYTGRASMGRSGEEVLLRVADTGAGLTQEEEARVFERFYRSPAATSGGHVGAGLGLAIVQQIVQLHGARVELGRSHLGEHGLSVSIFFPMTAQASP